MTVTLAKWTLEQYHQMIESGVLDDARVELLNGEIVEIPSEGPDHAYFNTTAANLLRKALEGRAELRDGKPITLPEYASEPEPDVAVVEPLDIVYSKRHPYPDNIYLLVEYSYASLAKDKKLKRKIYAKAGILEYWIVNLKDRQVIVHRDPQTDDYQSVQTLTSGTISMLAFPDVTIDIIQLL
ncbi:MAG: Uma2 family endonuclease [Alkalinema sp. RU_4_3]|nr:Uma2 family endonuclease [Alkalinema sp. RU_4_3]